MANYIRILIDVNPELLERVNAAAKAAKMSRSAFICRILEEMLAD